MTAYKVKIVKLGRLQWLYQVLTSDALPLCEGIALTEERARSVVERSIENHQEFIESTKSPLFETWCR